MVGSIATVRDGIVAYLALIEQMEMVAGRVIERNAGVVIKREAHIPDIRCPEWEPDT
jgi:hypothetical protein